MVLFTFYHENLSYSVCVSQNTIKHTIRSNNHIGHCLHDIAISYEMISVKWDNHFPQGHFRRMAR